MLGTMRSAHDGKHAYYTWMLYVNCEKYKAPVQPRSGVHVSSKWPSVQGEWRSGMREASEVGGPEGVSAKGTLTLKSVVWMVVNGAKWTATYLLAVVTPFIVSLVVGGPLQEKSLRRVRWDTVSWFGGSGDVGRTLGRGPCQARVLPYWRGWGVLEFSIGLYGLVSLGLRVLGLWPSMEQHQLWIRE